MVQIKKKRSQACRQKLGMEKVDKNLFDLDCLNHALPWLIDGWPLLRTGMGKQGVVVIKSIIIFFIYTRNMFTQGLCLLPKVECNFALARGILNSGTWLHWKYVTKIHHGQSLECWSNLSRLHSPVVSNDSWSKVSQQVIQWTYAANMGRAFLIPLLCL